MHWNASHKVTSLLPHQFVLYTQITSKHTQRICTTVFSIVNKSSIVFCEKLQLLQIEVRLNQNYVNYLNV